MSKQQKKAKPSVETRQEAMRIARANQRVGQTKAQTKQIAQGIQKGIEEYKRHQKGKARSLDRKLRKARKREQSPFDSGPEIREIVRYRQHWLPWLLLALSWGGMAFYLMR